MAIVAGDVDVIDMELFKQLYGPNSKSLEEVRLFQKEHDKLMEAGPSGEYPYQCKIPGEWPLIVAVRPQRSQCPTRGCRRKVVG